MNKRSVSFLCAVVVVATVAVLFVTGAIAHSNESPSITIQNQSSETVLTRLQGTTSGYLSVPAGGSRTAYIHGGNYYAFFRYGDDGRYSYSKVGPFDVVETAYEVSQVTIVLHTITGNTNEQPSNANEFGAQ